MVRPREEDPPPPYPTYQDWTDTAVEVAVEPGVQLATTACPICGTSIAAGLRECLICGYELPLEEVAPEPVSAEIKQEVVCVAKRHELESPEVADASDVKKKVTRKRRLKQRTAST